MQRQVDDGMMIERSKEPVQLTFFAAVEEFKRKGSVTLLFPLRVDGLKCSTPPGVAGNVVIPDFNFDENTVPRYPSIEIKDGHQCEDYKSVVFWNFLGDATHHSAPIRTPYEWISGDLIVVENRFNLDPTPALIESIHVQQCAIGHQWFWAIRLKKQ